MNPRCPCGSPRTIRHGTDAGSHLRLSGRVAERVASPVSRFLCKGCGKTFPHREPEAEAEERAVRDRAAELAFALGRAPAARELGVGPSVLATLLDRWHASRDGDTLDATPDFILAEAMHLRNGDAILVADVDRETLIEVLPDVGSLEAWLARPGSLPALRVCVPVDPALADAVRRSLPDATVMVAPHAVLRAIRSALALGLRIVRRSPGMAGRNAFPSTARFLRAVEGGREDAAGWPGEVRGLLAGGRLAMAIASAPDAARGELMWPEFEVAADGAGGGPVARLMRTWRDAILAGLQHRYVDRFAKAMEQVRRAGQARRPSLVFHDFRGFILLRDYGLSSMRADASAQGRPVAGLAGMMRGMPEPG
jgi:transposase-like protein